MVTAGSGVNGLIIFFGLSSLPAYDYKHYLVKQKWISHIACIAVAWKYLGTRKNGGKRELPLPHHMSPSRIPVLSCTQIPPGPCFAGYLSHVAQDFDFHLLYCFNYIPISQSSVWALLISCSSMDSQYLQKNKPVDHWVQTETWTLSSEWGTRVNVVIKKWEDMSPANMVLTPKRAPNHLDLLKPHSVTSSFGENKGFVGVPSFAVSQPWF